MFFPEKTGFSGFWSGRPDPLWLHYFWCVWKSFGPAPEHPRGFFLSRRNFFFFAKKNSVLFFLYFFAQNALKSELKSSKISSKNGVFWKMQNPAENFFRHFFVIFSHFYKNEIPWRMTKTRKNTKFAKKVSFRKLGSERREKKFRDQQFSCFE